MEYDLIRLFEHELLCFFEFIPSTIVTLSTDNQRPCRIRVEWRRKSADSASMGDLTIKWDLETMRSRFPYLDRQIRSRRESDFDRARRIEETAVVVAVPVMSMIEPETRFTARSDTGTRHDYYLNNSVDEMIEIAGRWEGGLPSLFDEKRSQSDQNSSIRKRWVSVTIIREEPRNRTEGLQ